MLRCTPFQLVCPSFTTHFDTVICVARYRLEVMVNQKDESTKFLLWDSECTELIGQSVDEVNRLKIAVRSGIIIQYF